MAQTWDPRATALTDGTTAMHLDTYSAGLVGNDDADATHLALTSSSRSRENFKTMLDRRGQPREIFPHSAVRECPPASGHSEAVPAKLAAARNKCGPCDESMSPGPTAGSGPKVSVLRPTPSGDARIVGQAASTPRRRVRGGADTESHQRVAGHTRKKCRWQRQSRLPISPAGF